MNRGNRQIYVLLFTIMVLMAGCGRQTQANADSLGGDVLEGSEVADGEEGLFAEEGILSSMEDKGVNFKNAIIHPTTVLEDMWSIYFCGKNKILKVDKETKESVVIWENAQKQDLEWAYEYSQTKGILIEDKIYFIEEWNEENEGAEEVLMWSLSVVCTDGTGYKRIENFVMDYAVSEYRLLLMDGILYDAVMTEDKSMEGYRLDEKGNLITEERIHTKAENVPAGYGEVYYSENGSRMLSAIESAKRFGYYLLLDEEYNRCIVDVKTGIKEELPNNLGTYNLVAISDHGFLFQNFVDEKLVLMDAKSLEARDLMEFDADHSVICVDKEYVYIQKVLHGDDFTQYQYGRVALQSGEYEELFTMDAYEGVDAESPWYFMDISVLNNYIYYVGNMDYKLYLMRRSLDMPAAEELLGEAIFDSGISEVGTIESYRETIYSTRDPEKVNGNLDLEWLVVDARYKGAGKINELLKKEQDQNIEYLKQNAEQMDEWEEIDSPEISFGSSVSPIYYMDGSYLSFVQENYEYSGGAHGMPYWVAHTFDLETGEKLALSDIVANEEAAIKEIVARYFTDLYNEEPDAYWEDAIEVVRESVSLQSPFYLDEEGIVFYYGPYELAPYAGGFIEVVVPYAEFDLKIVVQ